MNFQMESIIIIKSIIIIEHNTCLQFSYSITFMAGMQAKQLC